ncbi:DUF4832 domain-containing protein [Photobacterium damselae]|uniref:DUF4832 domain-containing protein n=1 Tax=Photobacterium damselae TaxID=38293 RepID=UPI0009BD6DC6|nr:DUF4832 domain-containing protein [Photobacterium damselae]
MKRNKIGFLLFSMAMLSACNDSSPKQEFIVNPTNPTNPTNDNNSSDNNHINNDNEIITPEEPNIQDPSPSIPDEVIPEVNNVQIITPQIYDGVLNNPDIGFTDFSSIDIRNDAYSPEPSYPETSVVYYRWYWEQLEPKEGVYDFSIIDKTLQQAIKHHKKLVFRVMTLASPNENYYGDPIFGHKPILGIPCWLKQKLISTDPRGTYEGCATNTHFIPNYNQAYFKEKITKLMYALGKKYDGKSNILRIDVGIIGTWGEWNMAERTINRTYQPDMITQGYSNEDLYFYINLVNKAFPNTTKTMLIGSEHEDTLSYSTLKDFGWRADCLGDWKIGWNHMIDGYPATIEHAKGNGNYPNSVPDHYFDSRWKQKPVDFEICNTMNQWARNSLLYSQAKVRETFNYALQMHASLINAKSKEIPERYRQIVQDTLKKLGYRFELVQLTMPKTAHAGENITLTSLWKNSGVAPSYNNYPIQWRLRSSTSGKLIEFKTTTDITQWQPADNLLSQAPINSVDNIIKLPSNLPSDEYYIDVALVDPETKQPKIQLGIEGMLNNKWYEVAILNITR